MIRTNIFFSALNIVILIFNAYISWSNYLRNRRIWEVDEEIVVGNDRSKLNNKLKDGKYTILKAYQDPTHIKKQIIYLLGKIQK